MADYYPLIARAISGLDPSAPGESRRALYERARSALIAQLRSVQPPLSESEITRERLSLEEAVRKVESEAAQRAREVSRSGSRAGDAFRAGTPRANPTRPGEPPARVREPAPPQANRSAGKTYANGPSPTPEFDRLEPSLENRGADPDRPYSFDESADEGSRWTPPPEPPRSRSGKRPKSKAARPPRVGSGF